MLSHSINNLWQEIIIFKVQKISSSLESSPFPAGVHMLHQLIPIPHRHPLAFHFQGHYYEYHVYCTIKSVHYNLCQLNQYRNNAAVY